MTITRNSSCGSVGLSADLACIRCKVSIENNTLKNRPYKFIERCLKPWTVEFKYNRKRGKRLLYDDIENHISTLSLPIALRMRTTDAPPSSPSTRTTSSLQSTLDDETSISPARSRTIAANDHSSSQRTTLAQHDESRDERACSTHLEFVHLLVDL